LTKRRGKKTVIHALAGGDREEKMIESQRDWSEVVANIQMEMGRLIEEVVNRKPPAVRFSPRTWQPAIDVFETDTEVVVLVELAGLKEDEIEVTFHNSVLTIRGERKDIKQGIRRTYSQMEILWGPFERYVALSANINSDGIKAFYEAGILEVVLPKRDEQSPHHVNVREDS
jgi:HSP20 family protein